MHTYVFFEPDHSIYYKITSAHSADSYQPVHPRSLIRDFAIHPKALWNIGYLQSVLRKLWSGLEDINLFSCSIQLSVKFFMLIKLRLVTIANFFLLNIAKHEKFSANKYENDNFCWHFHIY